MDVRFQNNSLSVSYQNKNFQLHPIWLRERLPGEEFFDVDTHQRLYEPSSIDLDLQISSAALSDHLLNIEFNDGVKGSYNMSKVLTSGGNDEIRGCTRNIGKKTDRARRQKRSLIILSA